MLKGKIGVTIARNATGAAAFEQAKAWAKQLGAEFLPRPHNMSVDELMAQHALSALIVGEKQEPRIHSALGSFAYHPGMAVLRLQQLKRGAKEHLLDALALAPGKRVLDATLGLAADAALAAYAVGEKGSVVGLEASPLLHFAVSYGLAHYEAEDADLTQALRRIKPVQAVAADFLAQCAPQSFDVVYFDPMFRHPVQGAKGMEALRPLSYEAPLDARTLKLAKRVAPRVVIKERSEYILRQYGCEEFVGGKYSRVKYGILKATDKASSASSLTP